MRILVYFLFLIPLISFSNEVDDIINDIKRGNVNENVTKLSILSDNGNADAAYELGLIYYDGIVLGKSYVTALKYFTAAAEKDHVKAQLKVADMYLNGIGTFWSKKDALKWYERAGKKSNYAKYLSGKLMIDLRNAGDEDGVKQLIEAGGAGIRDAYCLLGRFYFTRYYSGNREKNDEELMLKYYKSAAEMGDIESMCMYARMVKDPEASYQMSIKAASYGCGYAFYLSCCLVLNNDYINKKVSRVEFYKMMLLYGKCKNIDISLMQKEMMDKFNFTKEEIEEATRLANEWKPIPLPPAPVVKNP